MKTYEDDSPEVKIWEEQGHRFSDEAVCKYCNMRFIVWSMNGCTLECTHSDSIYDDMMVGEHLGG